MATTRIMITLPDDQLHSIRELVAAGKTGSVSAFVKHAVAVGLFDVAGWRAMLNYERKWADTLLDPPQSEPAGKTGSRNRNRSKAA